MKFKLHSAVLSRRARGHALTVLALAASLLGTANAAPPANTGASDSRGPLAERPVRPASNEERFASGHILVAPKGGLPEAVLDRVLEQAGGQGSTRLAGLSVRKMKVPPGLEKQSAERLRRNPNIEFAETDAAAEPAVVVNDQYLSYEWHLPKMQVAEAWDVANGSGIVVAVLDDGVEATHPDLQGQLLSGRNVVSGTADTTPLNGHGTAVAGTIAAASNNGIGVAAPAFGSKILPVRITNDSTGWALWSDMASGIVWAVDNGARVINLSYGPGLAESETISSAAAYARSKGAVVVVSAGNNAVDTGMAPNDTLLTVSATNSSDALASFSSFGNDVDFAAPGEQIATTWQGGGYGWAAGTSFSAPLVSAVVAQMMSVNPQLTPSQLEALLQTTAVDVGTAGWDNRFGFGRINALAAVSAAQNSSPSDSQPPSVSITQPAGGVSVDGIVTIIGEATDNYGVSRVELYANGRLIGSDTTTSYSYAWDSSSVSNGLTRLVLRAFDEAGNQSDSTSVEVEVTNVVDTTEPVIAIVSPSDGASVSTSSVSLAAAASDDVAVVQVSVFVDGSLKCSGTSSASCSWNTRKVTKGSSHTILARAVDAAGNQAETSITVTVGATTTDTTTTDTTTTDTTTTDTTTTTSSKGRKR